MRKYYVIKDMVQTSEDGLPLYYCGEDLWKPFTEDVKEFTLFEDAQSRLNLSEFKNGHYTIELVFNPR